MPAQTLQEPWPATKNSSCSPSHGTKTTLASPPAPTTASKSSTPTPDRVVFWDDKRSRCIGDIQFSNKVRGLRLRRDRVVVVFKHQVYVYNLAQLRLLERFDTSENGKGLCCVSQNRGSFVMTCLGLHVGQVMMKSYGVEEKIYVVDAHDSKIAQLGLASDGSVLASASVKGTLIRIFNADDGTCLKEVRRGTDKANIHSIDLSHGLKWLLVSSAKGTVHVLALNTKMSTHPLMKRRLINQMIFTNQL